MNATDNVTNSKGFDPPNNDKQPVIETVIASGILSLIIAGGIAGNLLILTAIYRYSSLRTMTNVFVANLAVADLLLSVLAMPFTLTSSITEDWVFGNTMCKLHGILNSLFCEASILTLTFVSLERFIAIIYPLQYHTLITPFSVKIMLCFIWFQAIVCASSPFLFSRYTFLWYEHLCTIDWAFKPIYSLTFTIIFFFLPFLIMIIFYGSILRTALKQRNKISGVTLGEFQTESSYLKTLSVKKDDSNNLRKIKKENKATIMIAIVVGTFSVCWFPHATGVYCLLTQNCKWGKPFFVITTWLAMLNSALNSIIYGLMNTSFRRAFKSIIVCDRYYSDNDIITVAEKSRRS
ncbi:G-protein coupled receptor 161-like [Actinia tenebrosa]|uniref:G-protein coupled receptor 161-like n=1 Tax=Actinia tenebrosa TaxID=6105 RepID=A0A6P8HAA6_ACTTE|nr:G-protein coupled receptor 161-like [Actinia tenebrosa]